MATITIEIPDSAQTRIRDAFAAQYGWTAEMGITKAAFAKAKLAEHVKSVVVSYEGAIAINEARKTKEDEINALAIT